MIFSSFSVSFWEYALDTIAYLLNLVPSKSVPLTPTKIWKGHKPSLQHIHIEGCPSYVLKPKLDELETRSKE